MGRTWIESGGRGGLARQKNICGRSLMPGRAGKSSRRCLGRFNSAFAAPSYANYDRGPRIPNSLNRSCAMFSHFALTEVSPTITHANTQADTGSQRVSRVMKLLAVLPAIFLPCLAIAAHADPVDCELNKVAL